MRKCRAMGTVYVLGGVQEALDWLDFLGIVEKRLADTAQFKPRDMWCVSLLRSEFTAAGVAMRWYASDAFARQLATFGYRPPKR